MRKSKRDEALRKLELKHIQEELQRDGGNTLRRYLDRKLVKELCMPLPRKLGNSIIKASTQLSIRWDKKRQIFIIYHCAYHNFYPRLNLIQTKCLKLSCTHLTLQKKKEVFVKTLQEAIDLKNRFGDIIVEQRKSGYRLTKNRVH